MSLGIAQSVFTILTEREGEPYELLWDFVRKRSFMSFQLPDPDVELDDTLLRTLLRRRCSKRSDGSASWTTASALVPEREDCVQQWLIVLHDTNLSKRVQAVGRRTDIPSTADAE
jgi:hypothetical protein